MGSGYLCGSRSGPVGLNPEAIYTDGKRQLLPRARINRRRQPIQALGLKYRRDRVGGAGFGTGLISSRPLTIR